MVKRKYKIIGICQIYNELEKGNLNRFIKYNIPLADDWIFYDDGSTDGSYELLLKHSKNVTRSPFNDFKGEIEHRLQMLEKAKSLNPDFILWLDADEIMSVNAKEKLQEVCSWAQSAQLDAVDFHEINIWRSATWIRLDSLYDEGWFPRLWRVTPELAFKDTPHELHSSSFIPPSINIKQKTNEISVLHYGFSDEKNLSFKYLIYRSHGQRGYEMLDRLISEEKLELKKISRDLLPHELWRDNETKPKPMSFIESLSYVESYRDIVFRPKYTITCLIYKSVDWLKFIYEQVLKYTDLTDKEFYFVANDADEEVINYLKDHYIPHYIWNNTEENKKQWYINNVYRAWNYAAHVAKGDFIVFVNSDMAFSPDWFENLVKYYNGHNCVASRLVESGKLLPGYPAIKKNFGYTIEDYQEEKFLQFAEFLKEPKKIDGGLYMPLLIRKDHFLSVGGYPEGNALKGSDPFKPTIAKKGDDLISGDVILMAKLKSRGVTLQTSYESLCYHFQCGEMDEKKKSSVAQNIIDIAICNDHITGIMGEKVLWNYLVDGLPGAYEVSKKSTGAVNGYEKAAREYIRRKYPETQLIIQNATFMGMVNPKIKTIVLLQDNLRSMGRETAQQDSNLKLSTKIVANSIQTAMSYPEHDCEIIPLGVDHNLFRPMDKKLLKKKHKFGNEKIGIFVGSLSQTKGWAKIDDCIKKNKEITWIIVSKYDEAYVADNARVYNHISQELLAELLNCADFFIIASPVETQCLAAIEACMCDIPVLMTNVGIFKEFDPEVKRQLGIFADNLEEEIPNILKRQYSPRETIIKMGLTVEDSLAKWRKLIEKIVLEAKAEELKTGAVKRDKTFLKQYQYKANFFIRKKIFIKLFGREFLNITKYLSKNYLLSLAYRPASKIGLVWLVKSLLELKRRKNRKK